MLYFNKQGFKDYLRGKNYPPKYAGYIDTIYEKILKPNKLELLFDHLEKCLGKDRNKAITGLEIIYNFITRTYSISKQPKIGEKAKLFICSHNMSLRSFNDYATGLNKYIEYIKSISSPKQYNSYLVTPWNKACNKLNLMFYNNISLNGINSLMCRFSDNQDFIKYVIENSFFFSKNMAQDRFKTIVDTIINKDDSVPARKSGDKQKSENGTDYFICENENKNQIKFKITIDRDGNRAVRDLIKNKTGYTLSSGEDSLFTNYIISHIWGDAFDPRNFTNFWNLAIVPAWANSLLDKTNSKDLLTKQLINTFKAVCYKNYNLKSNTYKWNDIFMKSPQIEDDYVLKGDYEIYIINKKRKNSEYGIIKKEKITII